MPTVLRNAGILLIHPGRGSNSRPYTGSCIRQTPGTRQGTVSIDEKENMILLQMGQEKNEGDRPRETMCGATIFFMIGPRTAGPFGC